VPPQFHNMQPTGCHIHKSALKLSEIEPRNGFMITRLWRTLNDTHDVLKKNGEWKSVVDKAISNGLLFDEEERWLQEDSSSENENNDIERANNSHAKTTENFLKELFEKESLEGRLVPPKNSDRGNSLDSMSEGVWKMIFDRSEAGRRIERAGFALVELLVVIAMISVLAAMLMPVLNKAMSTAHQVVCANQLKQLSNNVMLYSNNNNDYLPGNTQWNGTNSFWWDKLRVDGFLNYNDTWTKLSQNSKRITCCPSAGKNDLIYATGNLTEIPDSSADWTPTTYGCAGFLLGYKTYEVTGNSLKITKLKKQSRAVLLLDALMLSGYPWSGDYYLSYYTPTHWEIDMLFRMSPRHNGLVNMVHADGHTSSSFPVSESFTGEIWSQMFPISF